MIVELQCFFVQCLFLNEQTVYIIDIDFYNKIYFQIISRCNSVTKRRKNEDYNNVNTYLADVIKNKVKRTNCD